MPLALPPLPRALRLVRSATRASALAVPIAVPLIVALLACVTPRPDADALLREYKLEEAAAAWRAQTGFAIDFDNPGADGLARRAAHDPTITCAEIERRLRPARLLDQAPLQGRHPLDLSFPSLSPVLASAFDLGAALVAVGRSGNPHEPDVADGGDLPWADGRLVGGALGRAEAAALGAAIDADPPPRLVTVGMTDGAGIVFFTLQRQGDLWVTINSITPDVAGRWINFADYATGHGVEAARQRYGRQL